MKLSLFEKADQGGMIGWGVTKTSLEIEYKDLVDLVGEPHSIKNTFDRPAARWFFSFLGVRFDLLAIDKNPNTLKIIGDTVFVDQVVLDIFRHFLRGPNKAREKLIIKRLFKKWS